MWGTPKYYKESEALNVPEVFEDYETILSIVLIANLSTATQFKFDNRLRPNFCPKRLLTITWSI